MLDGHDSISGSSMNFSANALKLRALSLGVKQLEYEADHSIYSNSYITIHLHGMALNSIQGQLYLTGVTIQAQ
jgi:hypothetical protein